MAGRRPSLALGCLVVFALVARARAVAGDPPIFADDFESEDACAWNLGSADCPGFDVFVPPLTVQAGAEATWCYYFRAGNSVPAGVRRFESILGGLYLYRLDLYTTHDALGDPTEVQPPGTLTSGNCLPGNPTVLRRIYTAQENDFAVDFPPDDGGGDPVALGLGAQQPVVLFAFLVNTSDQPAASAPHLRMHTLASGAAFTPSHTFLAYMGDIFIPAMSAGTEVTKSCPMPASAKFWWFTTLTHSHATSATLKKGGSTILVNTDWEAPDVATFPAPAFFTFGAGESLTHSCIYVNNGNSPIQSGDSYATDETCEAHAYFFPATAPRLCFNGILIP